jgi:Leucine-rich repeat (LRR) protein
MPESNTLSGHARLMHDALPAWITATTPARIATLKSVGLPDPAPYPTAGAHQHSQLKAAIADQWRTHNTLDTHFHGLTDVYAFAEPLLKQALAAYGELDVRQVFLRTYANAANAWWVIESVAGETSRTCSLLEAALYNFADDDRFVDFAFLGPEDARGQRDVLNFRHSGSGEHLTAQAFKALCRKLDLGAQYQAKLSTTVGAHNAGIAREMRLAVIANLKAALTAATHMALLRQDLQQGTHDHMLNVIAGRSPHFAGRHSLSLMDCRLNGVMLFTEHLQPAGRVVAWVPEDPQHPVKEYPSPLAFVEELTRQLREPAYRQFFIQFIDHDQRGAFLDGLATRLSRVKWHQKSHTEAGPTWKDTPLDQPNLQFRLLEITQDYQNRSTLAAENDLWHYLYRLKLNKLLNDARQVAVSTAQVDRLARWAWWDNLEKILSDVLNVALLVVTPFVPVLGQLMLAYTAYQLADDVFEGIIDWAEGRGAEATQQLIGIAESVVQFGLFAGAGALGEFAGTRLSAFVEGLKPVPMDDGKTRLWHPDLTPYAQPQTPESLALEGRHYALREDPHTGHHRVLHPTRPQAYQPHIQSNGHGAWVHEGEQPRRWDSATLMRRLGPLVDGFNPQQQDQIRRISGSDDGLLQRVYVHQQPPPPLLRDTLQRFEAYEYPRRASAKIRAGEPLASDPSSDWFEQMVTELPGWPQDKAIEVFLHSDLSGDSHTYGAANAAPADTLRLSLAQVMSGQLPEYVLGFLDPQQITTLLGDDWAPGQQVQALRNQLADYVLTQTRLPAHQLHVARQIAAPPQLRLLPELGTHTARRLLASASDAEHQVMEEQHRLPLRLQEQARELALAERSVRAYEGFYDSAQLSADTEQLLLNTLKLHSDSFADLHLQIRELQADGALRSQAGPLGAKTRRVLVRLAAQRYEVVDGTGQKLHAQASLYESILHALPPSQRDALGFHPGQGSMLKQWLIETLEPLAERRKALAEPPARKVAGRETLTLLGGPALSRLRGARRTGAGVHARAALQELFPGLSEEPLERFFDNLSPQHLRTTLNQLTLEKQQLEADLEAWTKAPTRHPKGSLLAQQERQRRTHLGAQLSLCWSDRFTRHTNDWGQLQDGARLDLSGRQLPESLPNLSANFEHVTYLSLANTQLRQVDTDFLNRFPMLRSLNLNGNGVTRLPPSIGQMRFLNSLGLADNQLVLDPEAVSRLAKLRRLQVINLNNNPLELAPDISLMPNLRTLDLSRSQVNAWPAGLFSHPRPGGLNLNLSNTLIDHIPVVTAGTADAERVARTRLDRNRLSDEHRALYERYRQAAGLDPNRTYEPRGQSGPWLEGTAESARLPRQRLWDAVEKEIGSQGFFEVIQSLQPSYFEDEDDEIRYALNRDALRVNVWRMMEAVWADSELRERLFMMSSFPGLCADGGAQIFNEMGIEVLVSEANRYSADFDEREASLVTLASGSARIKHLGQVIRSDIRHRLNPQAEGGLGLRLRSQVVDGLPGAVDEVDIYLAYQTRLAGSLDLPWLADHMLYRDTASVSEAQVEQALASVQALGEGDGLVNQMLLEPYWEQFLRDSHDAERRANDALFAQRFVELDEQQDSLDEDDYNRRLNALGDQEKQWLRDLTRQAMARHSQQRNRAPR